MHLRTMSVAERVTALKNLFNDFGITVTPNSSLDLAIQAEFGRGKRSNITPLLLELRQESDAAKLATCIGVELEKDTKDPHVLAVANVLQDRLPPLLEILDVRQSTTKRMQLLSQMFAHFIAKIPAQPQSDRTLRMLNAAQHNLQANLQVAAMGSIVEHAGTSCNVRDLQRFGRVLKGVTPALIAIDQVDYPLEMKLNHCVYGLRVLAVELRTGPLQFIANILEEIHWLARVALPKFGDYATVEQSLHRLGISVGTMSMQMLRNKATHLGLTQQEMAQIIYASAAPTKFALNDQALLGRTQENQQYAAICGFVAKLAQDMKQPELEKISVAGICLASLRQTYSELKTNNLTAANFSESLGTILLGAGSIADNAALKHIGSSILSGVKAYAGLMAVPGGASLAVPLALCSVLGKLFLDKGVQESTPAAATSTQVLNHILQQVLLLQQQMRYEFALVYKELYAMQQQMLQALDQGFANLACLMRYQHVQVLTSMRMLDQRLQSLQLQISQEFCDLYLEYVHDPLEEVAFASRYGGVDPAKMQKNRHKLAMWLVHKAKHPRIIGGTLSPEQLPSIGAQPSQSDGSLALINRYVNLTFSQTLPEDLPHIPTWLLAANAYALISAPNPVNGSAEQEEKLLTDILGEGQKVLDFVQQLAKNRDLWSRFEQALLQTMTAVQARWSLLKLQIDPTYLQSQNNINRATVNHAIIGGQTCIASSATSPQQLEPFSQVSVDIGELWRNYLCKYIPEECLIAVLHGLGSWHILFTIDKSVNAFTDVHIPYGGTPLPNHARDVLFKVEVYYKDQSSEQLYLLQTAWFAYDLRDAQHRFDQYYSGKFKYPLKHNRYHWISVDGLANQVEGHGDTVTQKLIDYDRLGSVYKGWLTQALPVNHPDVLARVTHNQRFVQSQSALLERKEYTTVQEQNIAILRVLLFNQLRTHMHKQRVDFAGIMQQDTMLHAAVAKLDVYFTIAAIYLRILNIPVVQPKKVAKMQELLTALQQVENLPADFLHAFDQLFVATPFAVNPKDEYLCGEFYTKMQAALARLGALKTSVAVERLHLAGPL